MQWSDQRALVTGAAGFVGGHLVRRLMELGVDVRAFVRYTSSGRIGSLQLIDAQERPEIIYGDLRDPCAIRDAAKDCDLIFHLGAVISVPYSRVHPREVLETNVVGTLNVLMAADEWGAKVVAPSTSEVYGTAQQLPITEEHVLQGYQAYAASKIATDKLAESFWYVYELPVATVRPFNTYGPWQSARAFIPSCITQALGRGEIRMGYTDSTRDFTYVGDIVDGYIKAIECDRAWGQVVNLGTGVETKVGDLAKLIAKLTGDVPIAIDESRKGPSRAEVWRLCADNDKAKELMGWEPRVTLEEGLQYTIDSIREHLDWYDPERYAI